MQKAIEIPCTPTQFSSNNNIFRNILHYRKHILPLMQFTDLSQIASVLLTALGVYVVLWSFITCVDFAMTVVR